MTSEQNNALLVMDDQDLLKDQVIDVGERIGFAVSCHSDVSDFIKVTRQRCPAAVLVNLVMAASDGVEVIRKLADHRFAGEVCLFTDLADERVLLTANRLGASYGLRMTQPLRHPVEIDELRDLVYRWWRKSYSISREDLEKAIGNGEFTLYYQPKVQLSESGGEITEAEALIRWIHPELGVVAPDAFIPLAEKSGLIADLTTIVIDMALAQIAAWRRQRMSIRVGVNLSLQSLNNVALPDILGEKCAEYGVEANSLILEITETAAMGSSPILPDILTRLRIKGFELAMDDFGTGYSSLVQLYRMPFSELKIDQSFVMESDTSEEAKIIVLSILQLAKNLGLASCAEGVENAAAVDFCRSIGCDKIQGFYITKPLPAREFARFVQHWDADLSLMPR